MRATVWTFASLAGLAVAAPRARLNDVAKNSLEGREHLAEGLEQSASAYKPCSSSSNTLRATTTNLSPSGYGHSSPTLQTNGTSVGFSTVHIPSSYSHSTIIPSKYIPQTTVTEATTVYTTVYKVTSTATYDGSTRTITYGTTSTSIIIGNTADVPTPTNYEPSVPWSTVPWGSTHISYPIPSYPSISQPSSRPAYSPTTPNTPPVPTGACIPCEGQPGNDPDSYCGYTINDDWMKVTPITCRTREYTLKITNTTIAPDGVPRIALLLNGQMPGPRLEASWGDTVVVHLENLMQDNGTSLHFHGIRQFFTNEMDGVPSITQCALAPGEKMTYTFRATNYGSSWYHSHFALQTYMGVFGPLIINGPTAMDYDEEQVVMVQDWSHATVDSMYEAAQTVGEAPDHGPRTLDTGLINGKNLWGVEGAANATGERFRMVVTSGKRYRIRLVNTAIQSTFKFSIDGHKFQVIANDFVPIRPYEATIVNINIGQRYDLIFTADQPVGNYWMRSDNQNVCAAITHATNIKGIVSYVEDDLSTPTSTAYTYTEECVDEPYASLVPIVPLNAGEESENITKTVVVGGNGATPNLYKWTLSGTTFQSQWGDPTLSSIVNNNNTIPTYSGDLAIQAPDLHEWIYVIIDSPVPLPHPIHLHGHDVLVLAQGKGLYNENVTLNTVNPPRRDVVTMPWDQENGTGGYLVLAFETDNPGVWLMHCHIGWHTSMGFALQIIENLDSIASTVTDKPMLDDTCYSWQSYAQRTGLVLHDSGV